MCFVLINSVLFNLSLSSGLIIMVTKPFAQGVPALVLFRPALCSAPAVWAEA